MSIVQTKIRSSIDLLEQTGLHGLSYTSCDVNSLITGIWSFVDSTWKQIKLEHFTNHNLAHSLKIIDYFYQLEPLYKWSQYEKFIFVTAALIHDIGMQYNDWKSSKPNIKGFPAQPLSNDLVRKQHAELGFKLINSILRKNYEFLFPGEILFGQQGQNTSLYHASYIAFSHSGNLILKKLIQESTWKSREIGGETFRPRLLAGTLRLCDEFDSDYQRILQPEKIYSWDLSPDSKRHWLACLFVENTSLKIENNVVKINIFWQVPDDADEELQKNIKLIISKMREVKIKHEIGVVRKFYETCDEHQLIREYSLNKLPPQPIKFPFKITPEIKTLINQTLKNSSQYVTKSISGVTRTSSDIFDKSPIIPQRKEANLELALSEWFDENKETGHYELINNNEHTDTYLNCRTLVSDQTLLRLIAEKILLTHNSHNINSVLAVGTSAIPLSVILAYRLKAAVTFTVSRVKFSKKIDEANPSYTPIEMIPCIENNSNLLIIDDVISGGNVTKDVLDLLHDDLNIKLNKIYHHAIFKLGNRKHIVDSRIDDYFYIIHKPEVMYADSPQSCPMCQKGIEIIKEQEMY